jgi:hypothetical protein
MASLPVEPPLPYEVENTVVSGMTQKNTDESWKELYYYDERNKQCTAHEGDFKTYIDDVDSKMRRTHLSFITNLATENSL